MSKIVKSSVVITILSACICTTGCIGSICGTHIKEHTIGRELMDLQEAKDKNIISNEEFFKKKSEILEAKKNKY